VAASPTLSPAGHRLYFAARASGLYRSEDNGASWDSVSGSLNAQLVTTSVVLAPNFAAGEDTCAFAGVPGGVLRSTDAGKSWQPIVLASPAPLVSVLGVSPGFAQDGTLWAGTLEDGIFRSEDCGQHWSPWNFGLFDLHVLSLAVAPSYLTDKTLYAGTENGIYRSVNGGRAWQEVDFPAEKAPVLSLALSPAFSRDGVIFAGTEAHGLLRSANRGATWNCMGENAGMSPVNQIIVSSEYPALPHVLVQGNGTLFLSRDDGQSWQKEDACDFEDQRVSAVAAPDGIAPQAAVLLGLTDGSIRRITLARLWPF
jgi:photosystem II stability/assembly factor-like uncharacterized protein